MKDKKKSEQNKQPYTVQVIDPKKVDFIQRKNAETKIPIKYIIDDLLDMALRLKNFGN